MNKRDLLNTIVDILEREYGSPDLGNKKNPIDEIIYLKLCTKMGPKVVTKAYQRLKNTYPTWDEAVIENPEAIARTLRLPEETYGRGHEISKILRYIRNL